MHNQEFWWWKLFTHKELNLVYFSTAVRSFALSLIGLFVPLYLFKEVNLGLVQTLNFYIFYSAIFAIFTPLAAKFCSRFGLKHTVLWSLPFYLGFLFSLYLLPAFPLILVSLLAGLSMALYWMGMNLIFYHASDHKHRGEEVGKKQAYSILAATAGPILGGLSIQLIGFHWVFAVVSLLLIVSTILLFLSREKYIEYDFQVRHLLDQNWKNSFFFVSQGVKVMALGVIWPLFMFVILNDYFSLGLMGALISGISALLVWFTGRVSDHFGQKKIVRYVVGWESLSWFFRAVVSTFSQVTFATIFGAITLGILEAPLQAWEFEKAGRNVVGYFVSREIFICLGRILIMTFVLMTNSLAGGLFLTGITNLATLLF